MTGGWVKLHRKFMKWEWYGDSDTKAVFLHLLLSANHEDGRWQGVEVKRGQLITGRKVLSKELKISEQSIRTCLDRLKSTSELTIKSTNKYSIITVVNYDRYQSYDEPANQQINQPANQQSTNNQPTTNHKQEEQELKKKQENKKAPPVPCPPELQPWVDYRKKIKKPLKEPSIKQLIKKWGHRPIELKAAIDHSIEQGYQGLFSPKGNNNNKQTQADAWEAECLEKWGLDGEEIF